MHVRWSRKYPALAALAAAMPRGGALPERAWRARHRGITVLLWVHVVVLAGIGAARGETAANCLVAAGVVAFFAMAAGSDRLSTSARALMTTAGLLASSAILIEFFDGLIEAHFHFFVTVAVVSLYQSWRPYLLAVVFVLTHHLVWGTLIPGHVYNHEMALLNPWLFALVHGGAICAESVACLVFWKLTEEALDAERVSREELERTNARLARANVAVADLVAMLSHDLRTPLMVVIGYSELAMQTSPAVTSAQQVDFARRISRAGHQLHTMLDDMLTISAIDGDGVVPSPLPVQVEEAVREALAALPEAMTHVDLDELRPGTAWVDRGHLDQVLTNVLTNARKYGADSCTVSSREEGDHVVVRVTDAGTGVPAAFVPQLFTRFSRSLEARMGDQKGTGLGLFITRSLLVANGGDITYERAAAGGATFCLRLPRAASSLALVTRQPAEDRV